MEDRKVRLSNNYHLNNLIIITKYFIHKCKFLKSPPLFIFMYDLKMFAKSVKLMKNKHAQKLFLLFSQYDLV